MPNTSQIVINTSPLIAIAAAMGDFKILQLSGLAVTGSIGILLRAKKEGYPLSLKTAIEKMLNHNIRLSQDVIDFALKEAGEF